MKLFIEAIFGLAFVHSARTLGQNNPCESCSLQLWNKSVSTETLSVVTNNIFAIWWDPKFDHEDDADHLLEKLLAIRDDCLNNLGMADPPNPSAGFFYNVYIHHGEEDLFPKWFSQYQGTDFNGLPFLTLPYVPSVPEPHDGIHSIKVYHEGFHIFQFSHNSSGFAYSNDSQWYAEASAQWYMATWSPNNLKTYLGAAAFIGNPQLALWHGFNNEAPEDPAQGEGRPGWMYTNRQYNMHLLLMFLTEVKGVEKSLITAGFYAHTDLSPQEYLFTKIGPETFRGYFADWAAHNTGGLDYITREQVEEAYLFTSSYIDPSFFRPSVWSSVDSGTNGEWVQPKEELAVRGWAYNVYNISNTLTTSYTFQLEGESVGSQGATAYFVGRIVVINNKGESRYSEMAMASPLNGEASVFVTSEDSQVYLVVASVPEFFGSYQHYPYRIRILAGIGSCLEENTDYTGNNLTPITIRITNSWQECDALCNQFSQCNYWTWKEQQNNVCWLKTSDTGSTFQNGVFSGPKGCSLADPCELECNGHPCNSDNTACDCQNGSSQSDCSADPCDLECNGQPCNSDNTACDCQNGSSQSDCSGCEDNWPTKKCSKKCNAKKCVKSKSCKQNCKNTCDLCGIEESCEDQKSSKFCKKQLKKGKCSKSSVWKKCKKTCEKC